MPDATEHPVPHGHSDDDHLARLVDEGRLDDLLARVSLEEVADAAGVPLRRPGTS